MYTVVRFRAPLCPIIELEKIGEMLNGIFKFPIYDGIDRGDTRRFSCSICSDAEWPVHRDAIFNFIDAVQPVFMVAKRIGIDVTFDTSIEADDYTNKLFVEIPVDAITMKKFLRAGVNFIVTAYREREWEY